MRKLQLCFLLGSLIFATGCPNEPSKQFPKNAGTSKNSLVNNINVYLAAQQTKYYKDPTTGKDTRNEAIEDIIGVIDDNYNNFINNLDNRRSKTEFIADVVEIGTTGTIGIVKGTQRTIQILGIALTAFRGGRKSADLSFYKQQTTPILIAKMDDNRAKVYAKIFEKKQKSISEYSMKEAIRDLVGYYNAGTLIRAFTELSKDTAASAKASEDKVTRLELHGIPPSTISTEEATADANRALNVLGDLSNGLSGNATDQAAALKKLQDIVSALEKDPDVAPLVTMAGISSADTDGTKLLNGLVAMKRKLTNFAPQQEKINAAIVKHGK
jgi:hypothetical protein